MQALTALVELVVAIAWAFHSYPRYVHGLAGYENANAQLNLDGQFVLGATVFLGFLVSWRGIIAVVLFCEALVRLAGSIASQPVGTLAGWSYARLMRLRARPKPLPLVEDRVTRGLASLVIESCHALNIALSTVVDVGDERWVCIAIDTQPDASRPHRYTLRPLTENEPVRTRVTYVPKTIA